MGRRNIVGSWDSYESSAAISAEEGIHLQSGIWKLLLADSCVSITKKNDRVCFVCTVVHVLLHAGS